MPRVPLLLLALLLCESAALAGVRVREEGEGLIYDFPRKRWLVVERVQEHVRQSRPRILRQLGLKDAPPVTLIFSENRVEFRQFTGFEPERWVAARAFPRERKIVLRTRVSLADLPHTVDHELAHIYLYDALGEAAHYLPLWMHEGIAKYLANDWRFEEKLVLRDAVLRNRLLDFDEMTTSFPGHEEEISLAYVQSYTFVQFLFETYGEEAFARFLEEMRRKKDARQALESALGRDVRELEREWLASLKLRFRWQVLYHNLQNLLWAAMGALVVALFFLVRYRHKKKLREMEEPWLGEEQEWQGLDWSGAEDEEERFRQALGEDVNLEQ